MGVGSGRQGGRSPLWIFIHSTDKVEGGLIVLFFGLIFSVGPPLKNFLPTPLNARYNKKIEWWLAQSSFQYRLLRNPKNVYIICI